MPLVNSCATYFSTVVRLPRLPGIAPSRVQMLGKLKSTATVEPAVPGVRVLVAFWNTLAKSCSAWHFWRPVCAGVQRIRCVCAGVPRIRCVGRSRLQDAQAPHKSEQHNFKLDSSGSSLTT